MNHGNAVHATFFLTLLEVRVDHLPSKGFIVSVVLLTLTVGGAFVTFVPKLQQWLGILPH